MTSGTNSDLYVASVSDVHLGHRQTPTKRILTNLRTAFPRTEATKELDAIFVVGDLFDGPLPHYSEDAVLTNLWMADFVRMAHECDVIVRVLEGTRSHDWKQNIWFNVIKYISQLDVDVKYVSELSIEYIEKLGIHVLYVPDEWRPETDQTWMEVKQLLAEKNLEQVDFTLIHGAFAEQMPEQANCPKHIAERYQSITRKKVFAGHIHQKWSYGNILGNGSFDRLGHGEEESKGHWRVRYQNGHEKVWHVENQGAMIYRTIRCGKLSIEEALAKIEREVSELPEGSQVRIEARQADAIVNSLDLLKKKYRQFVWTVKTSDKKDSQAKLLVDHRPKLKGVPITASNIRQLIDERLSTFDMQPEMRRACAENLTAMGL